MITIPASCPEKWQFRRLPADLAMLLVVIGSAILAAAIIVRTSAGDFPFRSGMFAVWTALFSMIVVASLFFLPHITNSQPQWLSTALKEALVWQAQFANSDEEEAPVILIAAADVFMRSALDFHFTRAGFRVEHAANRDEALLKMKTRPAAVLLDLGLPNDNGFYCLRDCRKASPSSKIITFTRKHHPQDAVLCRKLGAYDSMPKPFDPTDAVAKAAHALHGKPMEEIPLRISA